MSATRRLPRITTMFSSLAYWDGPLKFAVPVTTVGWSPNGSTSMNLSWMYWFRLKPVKFSPMKKCSKRSAQLGTAVRTRWCCTTRNDEQKVSNEEAIQQFHLENICHPRNAQG